MENGLVAAACVAGLISTSVQANPFLDSKPLQERKLSERYDQALLCGNLANTGLGQSANREYMENRGHSADFKAYADRVGLKLYNRDADGQFNEANVQELKAEMASLPPELINEIGAGCDQYLGLIRAWFDKCQAVSWIPCADPDYRHKP